jgi:hypothetical protein
MSNNNIEQVYISQGSIPQEIEIDGYTKYLLEYEKKPLLDINLFNDNFEYKNNVYLKYPLDKPIGYNIGFLVQNKNKKHINHYFDIILKNEEIQTLDKNDIINYAFDKLKTHILKWSYENLVN